LMRLGRLDEAEAALREAARIGAGLSYTPVRIFTSLARLLCHRARYAELRALGEECLRSDDVQREVTRTFGQVLVILSDVTSGHAAADWSDTVVDKLGELRRLGLWPVAYRYVAMQVLGVAALHGDLPAAERLLAVAERALEWSPSPTASAMFRRSRGIVLLRRGRLAPARQALEAALATFEVAADVPESALARRALVELERLAGTPGAEPRVVSSDAELNRLGLAVPPRLVVDVAAGPAVHDRGDGRRITLERLVVPLQRLATRGVGASILQKELVNIVTELFPGRAVRLEEVDSVGATHPLDAGGTAGQEPLEWFDFSDGAGCRMRLGLGGTLDDGERTALQVLLGHAALALEVVALRGLRTSTRRPPNVDAADEAGPLPGFVAVSPPMRRLKVELSRLSGSRGTIIVTGQSGTGKEVVARAIHDLSRRAGRPYVTFNCAGVPRELFEGQLFGYRRGAFTGATADHPGVIRAAEGGTLFLDEVGELPLDVQPKLLRFLENGEILPLGERKPVQVDVRVIAATHRDLLAQVREGRFREDLYYRLQVIPVHIPPLRERREDVLALARFFIRRLVPAGVQAPLLGPDGEHKLLNHSWPGNVRELRNVIERSLAYDPLPPVLGADDLRI
ncbi:MAG: sigma 54-interacting transcriptional regulator, partial [Myxococcales bacterium]